MVQRCVFPGEIYSPLRTDDLLIQQCLLPGVEKCEGSPGKFIIMPHPGCAHLKLLEDLGMDLCHILQRLFDAVLRGEGPPTLSILGPGITGQDDAPPCFPAMVRIIQIADGQVSDRAASEDPFILLPEPSAALE